MCKSFWYYLGKGTLYLQKSDRDFRSGELFTPPPTPPLKGWGVIERYPAPLKKRWGVPRHAAPRVLAVGVHSPYLSALPALVGAGLGAGSVSFLGAEVGVLTPPRAPPLRGVGSGGLTAAPLPAAAGGGRRRCCCC